MSDSHQPRRPSVRDVAALAGVSVGTVSNVLNRPERVDATRRRRVEWAIAELGFVRHRAAGQLRAGRSGLVGVVVPDVGNPFWADVLRGIEARVEDAELTLLTGSTRQDRQREAHLLAVFEEHAVDGLLIAPSHTDDATLAALRDRGTPVVVMDRDATGDLAFVGVDDVAGARSATAHLIARGYESFALVNGPLEVSWSADRRAGVLAALHAAGLDPARVLAEVPVDDLVVSEGTRAGAIIAASEPVPRAVICVNDLLALGVLHALRDAGLRTPEEVALVGYDDVPFAAALSPALTTVRQDPAAIGRTAADLLLDGGTGSVRFEPQLVVRAST